MVLGTITDYLNVEKDNVATKSAKASNREAKVSSLVQQCCIVGYYYDDGESRTEALTTYLDDTLMELKSTFIMYTEKFET